VTHEDPAGRHELEGSPEEDESLPPADSIPVFDDPLEAFTNRILQAWEEGGD
jgi:hypothetical protein